MEGSPNGNAGPAFVVNTDFFSAGTLPEAQQLMLPGEHDTALKRWAGDTNFLCEMIKREIEPKPGDMLLDYGCGVGRIAKVLCSMGLNVVGVEPSAVLRQYAVQYVNMPGKFMVFSPEEFDALNNKGLKCDHCYCFWTLQHVAKPLDDIQRMSRGMKTLGKLLVANHRKQRQVPIWVPIQLPEGQQLPPGQQGQPVRPGFFDDGIDLWELLGAFFGLKSTITYPYGLGLVPEEYLLRGYCKTI